MNKIDRLMAILLQLKKQTKVTANELATTFEVTPRTIYRDIQALSEMGIPIIALPGNEGGYLISDHFFIPPIMFSKEEVFSLLLAEQMITQVEVPGHQKYINTAFLKIKNVLDDESSTRFQRVHKRITFDIKQKRPSTFEQQPFHAVSRAIEHNQKLAMTYFHPKKQELTNRKIHPYGLIFEDGLWYLVAYCELRKAERMFAVNRIHQIEVVGETFSLPEGFELRKYFPDAIYTGEGDTQVLLKVVKSIYHIVKDYHQLRAGVIYDETDDSYIISLLTNYPRNYISFAFRFFGEIEIIEPLSLRDEMKETIAATLKKYQT
ncbi:helix-turn-helix transcriptional regulator [Fredinandcohnia humi]